MPDLEKFVVFYSWQSDLPDETNRQLIREGLRDASSKLETEYSSDSLQIEIDEATRGIPGSPNIPLTIFEKIRSADAFVADITTIVPGSATDGRACPPECPRGVRLCSTPTRLASNHPAV